MKKIVSLILIVGLITSCVSLQGCHKKDEISLTEKVDSKITAYKTDLEDSIETLNTNSKVCDYLSNWASAKGIDYTTDEYHNVIMKIETSESYASAPATVVICPYDAKQMQNSVAPMAIGMYLAKNNESTGRLKVIFTDNTGNRFSGVKKLSSKIIPKDSNIFCLSSNEKSYWAVHTGAGSSYRFTGDLHYTKPTKNKAFKITINGLPGGSPDASIGSYPNPVKRLGNLLAQFKTNALIYELADLHGGSAGGLYPESATATVVINEDDLEKFQKKIDKDIEHFNNHELDDYPDAEYKYEEVKMPKRVFTARSMDRFVSLLYTLLDGAYNRNTDNEELVSFTNIGKLRLNENTFTISATANSLSEDALKEIDKDYELICGLSDVTYHKDSTMPPWTGDEDSQFVTDVENAYNGFSNKKFSLREYIPVTTASYISRLEKESNVINLSVSGKGLNHYAGTILTFMMTQPHDEKKLNLNLNN